MGPSSLGAGATGGGIEGFLAWPAGAFAAAPGVRAAVVGRAVVVGRVVVVLVEEANDARGLARFAASAAGRVVKGRFGAAVAGAIVDLRSETAALPGEDRVAAVEDKVVLRAAEDAVGLLFSSPEVTEAISGSASDAVGVLVVNPARRAAVPGAGRVGGLFKLDTEAPVLIVELASGLDAVVEARAVVDAATGRFAAPTVVVGRRGGTGSVLGVDDDIEEAILRLAVVAEEGTDEVFEASAGAEASGASDGSVAAGAGSAILVQRSYVLGASGPSQK